MSGCEFLRSHSQGKEQGWDGKGNEKEKRKEEGLGKRKHKNSTNLSN